LLIMPAEMSLLSSQTIGTRVVDSNTSPQVNIKPLCKSQETEEEAERRTVNAFAPGEASLHNGFEEEKKVF
jgi:hypothetical protein